MTKNTFPKFHTVFLSDTVSAELPLTQVSENFWIYSFDMMGRAKINQAAAETLSRLIASKTLNGYSDPLYYEPFSIFLTAEAKAIALTENLARLLAHDDYVVLRKSHKAYMKNPTSVEVKSITTDKLQRFYLGEEKLALLKGKNVCVVDDVVSTGGTMEAILKLSEELDFKVTLIACALTEGERRTSFHGIPLLSIDHIPLPSP